MTNNVVSVIELRYEISHGEFVANMAIIDELLGRMLPLERYPRCSHVQCLLGKQVVDSAAYCFRYVVIMKFSSARNMSTLFFDSCVVSPEVLSLNLQMSEACKL